MKIVLFGASGMIGQGVLRECLLDPEVKEVLAIVRPSSPTGQRHEKLREIAHADFYDYTAIAGELDGTDACLFCLGVSSTGMSEADYTHVTYDLTMAAARVLLERSPGQTFIYISGKSTDSTEKGSAMWARVKGKTENALLAMPFKAKYMFRPGFIRPLHGIRSRTPLYNVIYVIAWPFYPLIGLWKSFATTTEKLGRAMLKVAKRGADKPILESTDINALGA